MKAVFFFAFFLLAISRCMSQAVVVNGYFNAADPRDEWTELLVIADNTDMRGWSIRDNNSSQTAWQTAATFTNNAFWNNMRAGTIIMLWHRSVASDGVTAHPTDVNKNDGYVELDLSNSTYFTGAALGSSPTWGGNSMNIAGGGDVLQLRDASGTHVHALGHISSPGTDWNALPSPKLNHANTANSGDAIYVCPGDAIADYGTTTPLSGTTWTSKNNSTTTFGLPNISGSSPTQNTALWDTLREPAFSNQAVTPTSVIPGTPGSETFSWSAATDPNVSDGTTGYLILRNTTNSFTAPGDGTTYTAGGTIGSATVIAQIASSLTTTYTDNTVMNGNSYYYRVYAYRYTTDNANGNSYHRSRGRAYTSTFVFVNWPFSSPLPVQLVSFTGQAENHTVQLDWITESETNNNYFSVERAANGESFEEIGRVDGSGTTSKEHAYSFIDYSPAGGVNYYRLRQTDINGTVHLSPLVAVEFHTENSFFASCYFSGGTIYYETSDAETVLEIYNTGGKQVAYFEPGDTHGELPVELAAGIYIVRFSNGKSESVSKIFAGGN